MLINLSEFSPQKTYCVMTQSILPRPIAWVISENDNQTYNLAPFSYFNAVCSNPPLIMFSIGLKDDGSEKDTLVNLRQRPQFVLNIASSHQLDTLNLTSATLPPGESEVEATGLQTSFVCGYSLPRLSDCKLAYMCQVYEIQTIGNNNQALVFGEIGHIYVEDDCITIGDSGRLKIDAKKIDPLARIGAGEYASLGNVLTAKRPD